MESISLAQAAALALLQGLTEFLPISSSAHLVLLPKLEHLPDQGLAFDVTVHLGTLAAVVWHFRAELVRMARGFVRSCALRSLDADADGRLAWFVLLATIPVGLAGLAFKDLVETDLRNVQVIAAASIGFGLLLWWADLTGPRKRKAWRLGDALLVGLAQALALIPGTSRSGITMTAALFLGYTRQEAARFSFLLAIPVIALAGMLKLKDWWEAPVRHADAMALAVGFVLSFVSAWLSIRLFLAFIERIGMMPFVLYRIALGIGLFAWA